MAPVRIFKQRELAVKSRYYVATATILSGKIETALLTYYAREGTIS
jgi:hypothetical protein